MKCLYFLAFVTYIEAVLLASNSRPWEGCDFMLTTPRGQFNSLDFPGNYPDSIQCSWLIITPANTSIRLGFNSFMTQRLLDEVTVYDGATNRSQYLLWHSGFEVPRTVESSHNVMLVTFTSDAFINYSGFSAEYITYVPQMPTTTAAAITTTAMPTCGGTMYGTGYILTPNYPSNYVDNANCIWYLQSDAQSIAVRFEYFDTENKADFVTVRSGWDPEDGPFLLRNASGLMGPFIVRSIYTDKMTIQFTSDDSITAKGFRAYFAATIN